MPQRPLAAIPAELLELRVPHLAEYFGPWAIQAEPFLAICQRVGQMDLRAHVAGTLARSGDDAPKPERKPYYVADGVAVIDLAGTLMKFVSSMDDGTSTVFARRQIRQAANDPDVQAIALRIDSPGGTVSGTHDLAAEVAAAAKLKPVHAYCEDLCCSAAYWVASQATRICANPTAIVGSIGTYAVIEDLSGLAAREGVKVHVVRAGQFKGAGVPGTEVTPEQLAEVQRVVDAANQHFLAGVAKGRRMTPATVEQIADGRVHVGQAAVERGLIDAIETWDDTLRAARGPTKSRSPRMSDAPAAPVAATFADLKAGLVGADAEFLCAQLERGATLAQAQSAWMGEQSKRLAAKETELKQLQEKTAAQEAAAKDAAPKPRNAIKPLDVAAKEEAGGDPIAAWEDAVAAQMKRGLTRAKASSVVARQQPELRERYVAAYNAEHRQPARR